MTSISRRAMRRIASIASAAAFAAPVASAPIARLAAQTPPVSLATSPSRLGDLYAELRRANPKIDAARALVRAAAARIPAAKRPPDPELQLGFMNYTLPGLTPMEPLGMTQLQLMQMVPTAGKLGLAGRVASARASAEGERALEVGWEVRTQLAMAFYELHGAEQALVVDRRTLRLLEDTRKIAEAMYRVGEGRQADVLRANVEIARMVEDTIRMATMRTAMAARLNALLDRDGDAPVGSPALPLFPDSLPALATLVAGVDGRAMVRAGLREVDAADAQATLARRELWPDLTVGIQYGQSRATMPATVGADGVPMPAERRTERMGSLMLGASIPVFARSRQLQMREEAAAMRRMADAELSAMRAETRGKIAEAHAGLARARRLSALYRTTIIPQAEAAVRSSLAAYRVGSVDFMTLLDNQMAANGYVRELATLEAEEGKGWAELEMLLGRELMDANHVAAARTAAGGDR